MMVAFVSGVLLLLLAAAIEDHRESLLPSHPRSAVLTVVRWLAAVVDAIGRICVAVGVLRACGYDLVVTG